MLLNSIKLSATMEKNMNDGGDGGSNDQPCVDLDASQQLWEANSENNSQECCSSFFIRVVFSNFCRYHSSTITCKARYCTKSTWWTKCLHFPHNNIDHHDRRLRVWSFTFVTITAKAAIVSPSNLLVNSPGDIYHSTKQRLDKKRLFSKAVVFCSAESLNSVKH